MSAGPAARIIGNWTVDFPRPRDASKASSKSFQELHKEIWSDLKAEVFKGYAQPKERQRFPVLESLYTVGPMDGRTYHIVVAGTHRHCRACRVNLAAEALAVRETVVEAPCGGRLRSPGQARR